MVFEMSASLNSGAKSMRAEQAGAVPAIGLAIPTYNRSDVLLRCFEHLESQTWKDFELVVVDDGSTDETPLLLEQYAARTTLRFRYVRQKNAGPARARNHAISLLTSPVCLIIGDDIMARPDLVEKHLAFHRLFPHRSAFALGYSRWGYEGQTVTPFMRWLEEGSNLQFAYPDLLRGEQPTWKHFYTSNLSGKTELLHANPFSESFTHAAMEDIELGYRLARRGELEMHFLPDAVGEHIHPTDVVRSCRRMMTAGAATQQLFRAWPELEPAPSSTSWKGWLRRRILERGISLEVLRSAADILTRFQCPNVLLKPALLLHHEAGLHQAQATDSLRKQLL